MSEQKTNSRQHHRIRYPSPERPTLELGGVRYPVIDLSESGLRFIVERIDGLEVAQRVDGKLVMAAPNVTKRVKGRIVRIDGECHIAVQLDPPWHLPFALLVTEQRRLIAKGLVP
jgi:hypothetical protein